MRKKLLTVKPGFEDRAAVFQSENEIPVFPSTLSTIYLDRKFEDHLRSKDLLEMLYHGEVDAEEADLLTKDTKLKAGEKAFSIVFADKVITDKIADNSNDIIVSRDLIISGHQVLSGNVVIAGKLTVEEGATLTIPIHSFVTAENADIYGTVETFGTMTKDESEALEQAGREDEKVPISSLYVTGTMNLFTGAKFSQMGMTYAGSMNVYGDVLFSGWYIFDHLFIRKNVIFTHINAWGEIQELHMEDNSTLELSNCEPVVMSVGRDFTNGFKDQNGLGVFYSGNNVTIKAGKDNVISYGLTGYIIGSQPKLEGNVIMLDDGGFIANPEECDNYELSDLRYTGDNENGIKKYEVSCKEKDPDLNYSTNSTIAFLAAFRKYLDEKLPDHGELRNFGNTWYACGDWDCTIDWHYKREEPFKVNSRYMIEVK